MYSAYVTTLKEIHKHSNADRLNCATVFGNNVIVSLDYYVGQKVIYFPVDGQLSVDFARENNLVRVKNEQGNNIGGYLDPEKRNITALKLRGEKSDGLVLPIEVLAKYTDVSQLKDGDQITELNGVEICRKYIPKTQHRSRNYTGAGSKKKREPKSTYPQFVEHSDTAQLAFNQTAFREGDTCYITLKMHGTSARTANTIEVTKKHRNRFLKMLGFKDKEIKQYHPVSGTRRVVLTAFDTPGYHGSDEFREPYHRFFAERLPKGVEVFYEIVGWVNDEQTIMGRCKNSLIKDKEFAKKYGDETVFSYGCKQGQNDCYVYRMTMTNPDGEVVEIPWETVQILCERMGVKCVTTFDKFLFTTWEDLMHRVEQFYDGTDPVGETHIREGVVVRIDNRPTFTAYKHKNWYFKCLEGIVKDLSDQPDMEEAQELLEEGDEYVE